MLILSLCPPLNGCCSRTSCYPPFELQTDHPAPIGLVRGKVRYLRNLHWTRRKIGLKERRGPCPWLLRAARRVDRVAPQAGRIPFPGSAGNGCHSDDADARLSPDFYACLLERHCRQFVCLNRHRGLKTQTHLPLAPVPRHDEKPVRRHHSYRPGQGANHRRHHRPRYCPVSPQQHPHLHGHQFSPTHCPPLRPPCNRCPDKC